MNLHNRAIPLTILTLLLVLLALSACGDDPVSAPVEPAGELPAGQTIEVTYTPIPESGGEAVGEASADDTVDAEAPAAPSPATIQEFKQALTTALTSAPRDYAGLQNLMGDSFEIMIWHGNGEQMTPSDAITALQTAFLLPENYITYAELTEIDTEAMFGGNPYQLYPNAADFLFSSGWGTSGMDEALLYFGQKADGSFYWQGVLYANDGFAASWPPATGWVSPPIEICKDFQSTVSSELGLAPGTLEENASFYDVVTNTSGTGCLITITGTGADGLDSGSGVFEQLSTLVQIMGWAPDNEHMIAGATGMGGGFTRDSALLIMVAGWEPSSDANCPEDQPIGMCELTPEQKLFTITLSIAMQ